MEAAPQVRLLVFALAKLNLAGFQNTAPALSEVAVCNEPSSAISDLTLTVTSKPAFLKSRTRHLETIGAGKTYNLTNLDVQLDGALLSRLTEAEASTLHFEFRSAREPHTVLAQHEQVVELLPRNQWGGIGQLPELVAAFVQRNDPAVDRLIKATHSASVCLTRNKLEKAIAQANL